MDLAKLNSDCLSGISGRLVEYLDRGCLRKTREEMYLNASREGTRCFKTRRSCKGLSQSCRSTFGKYVDNTEAERWVEEGTRWRPRGTNHAQVIGRTTTHSWDRGPHCSNLARNVHYETAGMVYIIVVNRLDYSTVISAPTSSCSLEVLRRTSDLRSSSSPFRSVHPLTERAGERVQPQTSDLPLDSLS